MEESERNPNENPTKNPQKSPPALLLASIMLKRRVSSNDIQLYLQAKKPDWTT